MRMRRINLQLQRKLLGVNKTKIIIKVGRFHFAHLTFLSSSARLALDDMILNNTLSNFLNSLRSLRKFFSPRRDIYFTSPLERMSALADRRGFNYVSWAFSPTILCRFFRRLIYPRPQNDGYLPFLGTD